MNLEEERKAFDERFGIDDANTFPAFGDGINSSAALKCNLLGWMRCAEQKQAEINTLKNKVEALQNAVIFTNECRKEWHESYMRLREAQAVPEGFVLVPMVPSERMVDAVRKCYEGEAYLPYSLYSEFINQAMIEAREQSNNQQEDAELNAIADSRKDQKRIRVNLGDL